MGGVYRSKYDVLSWCTSKVYQQQAREHYHPHATLDEWEAEMTNKLDPEEETLTDTMVRFLINLCSQLAGKVHWPALGTFGWVNFEEALKCCNECYSHRNPVPPFAMAWGILHLQTNERCVSLQVMTNLFGGDIYAIRSTHDQNPELGHHIMHTHLTMDVRLLQEMPALFWICGTSEGQLTEVATRGIETAARTFGIQFNTFAPWDPRAINSGQDYHGQAGHALIILNTAKVYY